MATDVNMHSTRVKEINEELSSTKTSHSDAVVATVAKLVAVNEQIQQRLAEAETKLQEQSKALETQVVEARTDALTRLPNRRAFDDEMARRFAEFHRHDTPFSVILLDIDHFKQFNDRYGHQGGDAVPSWHSRCLPADDAGDEHGRPIRRRGVCGYPAR